MQLAASTHGSTASDSKGELPTAESQHMQQSLSSPVQQANLNDCQIIFP